MVPFLLMLSRGEESLMIIDIPIILRLLHETRHDHHKNNLLWTPRLNMLRKFQCFNYTNKHHHHSSCWFKSSEWWINKWHVNEWIAGTNIILNKHHPLLIELYEREYQQENLINLDDLLLALLWIIYHSHLSVSSNEISSHQQEIL